MIIDPLKLSKDLISFPTVTPNDAGTIEFIAKLLSGYGFNFHILPFGEGDKKVINLYARYGDTYPNFCFAGHTDVVPVGDITLWEFDPFVPTEKGGKLFGRGACDMKPAIASFISAAIDFITNQKFEGSISLLITGDEEAESTNGTRKLLEWASQNNEKLSHAIVGEPTNPSVLGEMIKNGRRGSINFDLTVNGIQGHTAYPQLANNAVTTLTKIVHELKTLNLDDGNEYFQPSNIELTNIEVNNKARNIIPGKAKAEFNIRYNNIHTTESLIILIKEICGKYSDNYELEYSSSAEPFINEDKTLTDMLSKAIEDITGLTPVLSTSGGTSDARMIKNYCPVIEFGLINQTAHKVNEFCLIEDIYSLQKIYYKLLEKYFE